jgi:hypothetical protein
MVARNLEREAAGDGANFIGAACLLLSAFRDSLFHRIVSHATFDC